MRNTPRLALFLIAAAGTMAGFDGGCGSIDPQPLPPVPTPSPTPQPEVECVDLLDEASCTADASCRAIYVESACTCAACDPAGGECPPCDCPPPSRTFVGCQDQSGCEGLDEAACTADPACEPLYGVTNCLSAPPGDAAPCAEPGCGCLPTEPSYAGCRDRVVCPPILCEPCEYGMAVDENGCGTCECIPPPDPCSNLPEEQCIATPGCQPTYGAGTGLAPPCTCDGTGDCACPDDPPAPPPPSEYTGCIVAPAGCEALNEQQCVSTPGCRAEYALPGCAGICPEGDPNCGGERPECPPVFVGCYPDQPPAQCWSDVDCGPGFYCEYGVGTEPAPGEPTDPDGGDRALPAPPPGGICIAARCGDEQPVFCDALPPECGPGQVAGPWAGCWTCYDARTCTPIGQNPECFSDSDCFGGYCEYGPMSGGGAAPGAPEDPVPVPPPPPAGICVYPVCGDGQPVLCDALPPTCGVGQVAGAWNGCYACFDARTCQPVNQPQECTSDAECPNGYCDAASSADPAPGGGGSGAPFIPPAGMCVFPSCDDGSMLACRSLPPTCGVGQVVSLINGCWECRDARTCMTGCDATTTDCG